MIHTINIYFTKEKNNLPRIRKMQLDLEFKEVKWDKNKDLHFEIILVR